MTSDTSPAPASPSPETAAGTAPPAAPTGSTGSGAKPEPADDLVTTSHTVDTPMGTLRYTATTGRVVLRDEVYEDGVFTGNTAKAEMSVTSYVLDGADPTTRPVTFAFNGGPGSSSVWLHLGVMGPRRVLMGDVGALLAPPSSTTATPRTSTASVS